MQTVTSTLLDTPTQFNCEISRICCLASVHGMRYSIADQIANDLLAWWEEEAPAEPQTTQRVDVGFLSSGN